MTITLADLIADHREDQATWPDARPISFARWYRNKFVLGRDGTWHSVDIHKYRMNGTSGGGRIDDSKAKAEFRAANRDVQKFLRGFRQSHPAEYRSFRTWIDSNAFRRVYMGKAPPWDVALALGLVNLAGRMASLYRAQSEPAALQSYCDDFIGVDCSGFVNSYFMSKGRYRLRTTDSPSIAAYAQQNRRLQAFPGVPDDHVFCWMPPLTRGFRHIVLIDGWRRPPGRDNDPVGARLWTAQSSAALGGIMVQVYEILEAPPTRGANRGAWKGRRVAGVGDPTTHTIIDNWVYLAPPMPNGT